MACGGAEETTLSINGDDYPAGGETARSTPEPIPIPERTPTPEPPSGNDLQSVDAGDDIVVWDRDLITLTGILDRATGEVELLWKQVAGPNADIQAPDAISTNIDVSNVPHNSDLTFELTARTSAGKALRDRVNVTVRNRLEQAIETGNPAYLANDATVIENHIIDYIDTLKQKESAFLEEIYEDGAIHYTPGRNSQFINVDTNKSYSLVIGTKGNTLAAAHEENAGKSVAYGTNIFRALDQGNLSQYQEPAKNTLAWLLGEAVQNTINVAVILVDTQTFNATQRWLNKHYPNFNVVRCTNPTTISSCISANTDLVIAGSEDVFSTDIVNTLFTFINDQNIPKIYTHIHGWRTKPLTAVVISHFGFSMQPPENAGNYYAQDLSDWASYESMLSSRGDKDAIKKLIVKLRDKSFTLDLSTCDIGYGSTCKNIPQLKTEFYDIANKLKTFLGRFDTNNVDIFASEKYRLQKMLVLLADVYRQDIQLPMDKDRWDINQFMHSYFADYLVFNSRAYNPVQPDLGNFSRSNFDHVSPQNITRQYTSKRSFRAAGVYALPGQTFSVRRLDDNDVNTKIFINSVRHQSTQEFRKDGYNRPKFLKTPHVDLPQGKTITLTSPYGGPIQIEFDKNNVDVEITFDNVGQHPYWASSKDDHAFTSALATGDYDWAEFSTSHFEIHSQLVKMRSTMNLVEHSGTKLAQSIQQYTHKYPLAMAGFVGPGIGVIEEVQDFANENGWQPTSRDIVQHMNADQQACGAGCAGNPYDAKWSFNPLGHGDLHEFGHGLENKRFKFEGRQAHAHTNFYSYFTKYKNHIETGGEHNCQALPFTKMSNLLKNSLTENNSFEYMHSQDLNHWADGAIIVIQLMMAIQEHSALEDGWNLIPRLHILVREFDKARKSENTWLAQRDTLGFSQYSHTQANQITNNDFLLITIGKATGMNISDYLNMWGIALTDAALSQVNAYAYTPMPRVFYNPKNNKAYCETLSHPSESMDKTLNNNTIKNLILKAESYKALSNVDNFLHEENCLHE